MLPPTHPFARILTQAIDTTTVRDLDMYRIPALIGRSDEWIISMIKNASLSPKAPTYNVAMECMKLLLDEVLRLAADIATESDKQAILNIAKLFQ